MPLRVSNLRLPIDEPESGLPGRLARVLGLRPDEVTAWRILRKSLDARDWNALHHVYTAEVRLPLDEARLAELARRRSRPETRVDVYHEPPFAMPPRTTAGTSSPFREIRCRSLRSKGAPIRCGRPPTRGRRRRCCGRIAMRKR